MALPHPDEIPALSRTRVIQLEHRLAYLKNIFFVINCPINLDKLITIPYNIVITGFNNLSHIMTYFDSIPENIRQQFFGVYYDSDIEKQTAQLINPNIKYAHKSEYSSIITFIQSFYKNAIIWQNIDLLPKFHIVLQIWKQTNPDRLKELQIALLKNITNPFVHKVHISADSEGALDILNLVPSKYLPKITFYAIDGRLTYKNALEYISKLSINDFAAIINTDIYFDESIRALWNIRIDNTFLALLRYDTNIEYAMGNETVEKPVLYNGAWCNCSQDAWIFKVKDVIADRCKNNNWSNYDFNLGDLGCDNTIISELINNGWYVSNPCLTIKIYHLHNSNVRTYQLKNRISHGIYTFIMPSHILE